MIREVEKYFPLPWKVKSYCGDFYLAIGKGKNKNISFAKIDGGGWDWLLEDDQLDRAAKAMTQREIARYIVTCANLMPEAVEALKTACKALEMIKGSSFCETCDDNELCEYCDVQIALNKAVSFLAKLEGGGNDAQNS